MKRRATILCLSLAMVACASNKAPPPPNTANLSDLQTLNAKQAHQETKGMTSIRLDALRDTALQLGAQGALAFRAKKINAELDSQSKELDRIYNFNGMLLEHSVLPPVLVEGDQAINLDNDRALRISDKTFKIEKQARFVTAVPTWRDYLWMNFAAPGVPDSTLLPKNKQEQAYWDKYITQGWQEGLQQATDLFQQNLSRLKQDYNGMTIYRRLLAQHMVSKPYVARTDLGLTGDGDEMHINDSVLRITAVPQLQTDTKDWKPVIVK